MGFSLKKIGKSVKKAVGKVKDSSVGKLATKMTVVSAGVATGGLVKPQLIGIKNKSSQNLFDNTGKVVKGAAIAAGATFAAVGAPVALGGAGVGSGGLLAGAGGPLAGLFGKAATQGGVAPTTSLAQRMKDFTTGGEMGFTPQIVRTEQDAFIRDFDGPTVSETIKSNIPVILAGVALIGGGFLLLRRKG